MKLSVVITESGDRPLTAKTWLIVYLTVGFFNRFFLSEPNKKLPIPGFIKTTKAVLLLNRHNLNFSIWSIYVNIHKCREKYDWKWLSKKKIFFFCNRLDEILPQCFYLTFLKVMIEAIMYCRWSYTLEY